jgi:hypothetical protein
MEYVTIRDLRLKAYPCLSSVLAATPVPHVLNLMRALALLDTCSIG